MVDSAADFGQLAALTVTYHPDLSLLARQISALPNYCWLFVVDNSATPGKFAELQATLADRPRSFLICNERNLGLATAINQAAEQAAEHIGDQGYLLLMDQDSVPQPGAVEDLLKAYLDLQGSDDRIACVGPRLDDIATGLQHGFHRIQGWRWARVFPVRGDRRPIECANLNGSGTLVGAALFAELGGLDDSFFIDHVDTEWAFRVQARGYKLYGIPWVAFDHGMGEYGLRFWLFGWRVWPQRAPQRHYFLFRNALRLMRRGYVPPVWKGWAVVKLLLTFFIHTLFDRLRGAQVRRMLGGAWDGLIYREAGAGPAGEAGTSSGSP